MRQRSKKSPNICLYTPSLYTERRSTLAYSLTLTNKKIHLSYIKKLSFVSHKTHSFSIRNINRLMILNEITAIYPKNLTELINAPQCAQNADTVEVKSDDPVTIVL